jgi:hypothetical protein
MYLEDKFKNIKKTKCIRDSNEIKCPDTLLKILNKTSKEIGFEVLTAASM